jgi:hypothetical protein
MRRTQQFLTTREGGEMSGKVSVALAKCNVTLAQCLSHFVAALTGMLLQDFSFVFLLFCSFPCFPTHSR